MGWLQQNSPAIVMKAIFTSLFGITAIFAASIDNPLVFWIPNPCDTFNGLPPELQEPFKTKNPHVTNLNFIESYATYRLTYTPPPAAATWTWTNTGSSMLLTSHYNLETVTCLAATAGATHATSAATTAPTVAERPAPPVQSGETMLTSTTAPTPQTGKSQSELSTTELSQRTDTSPPASEGVSQNARRSTTTEFASTRGSADAATTPTTAAGRVTKYCFHDFKFWVDPDTTMKVIESFCQDVVNQAKRIVRVWDPSTELIRWQAVDGYARITADRFAIFLGINKTHGEGGRSPALVPDIPDFRNSCIKTFHDAWACKYSLCNTRCKFRINNRDRHQWRKRRDR